jgi:hypothetical protein
LWTSTSNKHSYVYMSPHQAFNYKTPLQFLGHNGIVHYSYPSDPSHMQRIGTPLGA